MHITCLHVLGGECKFMRFRFKINKVTLVLGTVIGALIIKFQVVYVVCILCL